MRRAVGKRWAGPYFAGAENGRPTARGRAALGRVSTVQPCLIEGGRALPAAHLHFAAQAASSGRTPRRDLSPGPRGPCPLGSSHLGEGPGGARRFHGPHLLGQDRRLHRFGLGHDRLGNERMSQGHRLPSGSAGPEVCAQMVNETLIDPGCRTACRNRPTGLPGQVPEQDMMTGGLLWFSVGRSLS